MAHHVTQRGNYRQVVFFSDDDRRRYLAWLEQYARKYGLEIRAYCLMSNHVHLLAVPRKEDSLARALAATHARHAQAINAQREAPGRLWQGRFYSCPLDKGRLIAARPTRCWPAPDLRASWAEMLAHPGPEKEIEALRRGRLRKYRLSTLSPLSHCLGNVIN